MNSKHMVEKKVKERKLYSGAVSFRADIIRLPDGKKGVRGFLEHHGAVAVLPILPNGDIVLVKQYRYPVGQVTIELPAGKLHSKYDQPLKRAAAELKEETGYTARSIKPFISFWPTSAFSTELLRIYIATGLKAGAAMPDEDEFLALEHMPFKKAYDLVRKGKIKDAKTIIALQAYKLLQDR